MHNHHHSTRRETYRRLQARRERAARCAGSAAPVQRRWLPVSALCALALMTLAPSGAASRPATMAASAGAENSGPRSRSRAALIPIHDEINDIKRDSISRRIEAARAADCDVLIFEMDTPGGLVSSALDICRMIKNIPEETLTVAWVHTNAYSAGAMISLAADEIWMSPSSSIGDCAPIMIDPSGGVQEVDKVTRAKVESPILQEFRDSAARNGYNALLTRAMVVLGEEIWWIESTKDGERRFVSGDDKEQLIDDMPEAERVWRLVDKFADAVNGNTYTIEQPINRKGSLLTMSQNDAVAFGFAKGIASDASDLTHKLGLIGPPATYDTTIWEEIVLWLNSPVVRGVLLGIVLIGGTLEFKAPGLIIPGAAAAIALAIFLAAPYAAGLADVWPIVVLGIGLLLLLIEIFVTPGFGVLGLLGIGLMSIGVIGTFVPAASPGTVPFSFPNWQTSLEGVKTGITVLGGSVVMAFVGLLVIARYLPKIASNTGGLVTGVPIVDDGGALNNPAQRVRLGEVGVVRTDLRPGGQAQFGDELIEVQSQSGYVEAGRIVEAWRYSGPTMIVRPIESRNEA